MDYFFENVHAFERVISQLGTNKFILRIIVLKYGFTKICHIGSSIYYK